jgi:hypothetical protein
MSMPAAIREKRETQDPAEPFSAALEHIEKRGSLLSFAPDRAQRLELMKAMSKKGLVAWNATARKYELTTTGGECLAEHRRTILSQSRAAR